MADAFGTILLLFGMALFVAALWAFFWPLPKLRMPTRNAAVAGLALSVGSCVAAVAILPDPPATEEAAAADKEDETAKANTETDRDKRAAAKEQAEAAALSSQARSGWRELLATVAPCDQANSRLAEALDGGGGSMYEAYGLATSAAKACRSTWLAFSDLRPPKNARGALRDQFEDTLKTCKTAYYMRKESLETAQSIFDGNIRPSAVATFKDEATASQRGILACVAGYMSAATKAGVDLEEMSSTS